MKKKGVRVLKAVLFVAIFVVILTGVSRVLVSHDDTRNYQWIAGFYEEEPETLDAVYLGGSNVYTFWEAPLAWHDYGIAVYPYTCSAQPNGATKYLVEEARKTQPDALYIVSLNRAADKVSGEQIHYLTDYMPYSINRFRIIHRLCGLAGLSLSESLEYYFPLTLFHSRWSTLTEEDFSYEINGLKGACSYTAFLKKSVDVSGNFRATTRRDTVSEVMLDNLNELMDYCDEEGVRLLFVLSPQSKTDESYLAKLNTVVDLVESRGYSCVNMMDQIDEIGLDLTIDYYSELHTNIHGSLKTTNYLAEYLVENYGFEDKRGQSGYEDWDASYDQYLELLQDQTLDIERDYETRDYSLAAPEGLAVTAYGTTMTVTWEPVEGADGYRVYRKQGSEAWEELAETEELTAQETGCAVGKTYTYTVLPYRLTEEGKVWGKYLFEGVSAAAKLDAPTLLSLEKTEEGVTVTWEEVEGASSYLVYRRVPGKTWRKIATVKDGTSYLDGTFLDNLPYEYTVSASTDTEGSYDKTGLLYLPDLILPEAEAEAGEEAVTLTWDAVEGMSGYCIYRRTEDTDWELTADGLDAASTQYTDVSAPAEGLFTYRVEAFLEHGSESYTFELENAFEWLSRTGEGSGTEEAADE